MAGIKEISEAITGINEIGIVAAKQFKDGVQFADFTAFYSEFVNNAEFKAKVEAAYNGFSAIPAEAADLDISEIIQLVILEAAYVPRILEALKK